MILDWDVHHGNGTNDLFYDDDSVLMVDMHEDGVWPGSGQLQETGTGQGQGHTINIPLPSVLRHVLTCKSTLAYAVPNSHLLTTNISWSG